MAAEVIRRLLENVRRRSSLRRAIIAQYDEGMCRHVHARIVASTLDGDTVHHVEYVHGCGDACAWLAARNVIAEHLGTW